MQRQIKQFILFVILAVSVHAEAKVESNAVAPQKDALEAQESAYLPEKHQEKRYIPYTGAGTGYYGSGVDYYNRPLGYDALSTGGYNNLGYGGYGSGYNNAYGAAGYGGYGNAGYGGYGGYGSAGYGGYGNAGYGTAGYGGYGAAGYGGGYNAYNRPGYRSGYGYNSYPSSYYSGGYGNSIVGGGTLGALGGAAGYIPPVPAAGGYNYGIGTGTIY